MLVQGARRAAIGAGRRVNARRWCSSSSSIVGSDVPEESDWWVVEGELVSVTNVRTSKKKEAPPRGPKTSINHISAHRVPDQEDQKRYWQVYLEFYENSRDEWEKIVWDTPKSNYRVDDDFFDAPLLKKKKKARPSPIERKPFSMEEIQAAIRENVRSPVSESKIEYRTAADSKWPF